MTFFFNSSLLFFVRSISFILRTSFLRGWFVENFFRQVPGITEAQLNELFKGVSICQQTLSNHVMVYSRDDDGIPLFFVAESLMNPVTASSKAAASAASSSKSGQGQQQKGGKIAPAAASASSPSTVILPTLFTAWICPQMMPSIVVRPPVVEVLNYTIHKMIRFLKN